MDLMRLLDFFFFSPKNVYTCLKTNVAFRKVPLHEHSLHKCKSGAKIYQEMKSLGHNRRLRTSFEASVNGTGVRQSSCWQGCCGQLVATTSARCGAVP